MFLKTIRQRVMFHQIVVLLEDCISLHKKGKLLDEELEAFGRGIGHHVFDLSQRYTGYTSQDSLIEQFNAKVKGTKCTVVDEHGWPRQWAGVKLIKKYVRLGRVDKEELERDCIKYNSVHRTTQVENLKLKPHQKVGVFKSPKQSYERAGIRLLVWENGTKLETLPIKYPRLKKYLVKNKRKGK